MCVCVHEKFVPAVEDEEEEKEEEEEEGEGEEGGRTRQMAADVDTSSAHMDSFDEVYKTYELTDFDRLLSRNIGRTE